MQKRFLYLVCLFLLACSSNSDKNKTAVGNDLPYIIDLDNATIEDCLLYSSVFSKMKTIVLENTEESVFGEIDKMDVCNDHIVILDYHTSQKILVFGHDGKFIRKIGAKGSGPSDYAYPTDFTIDKERGEIYIWDDQSKKILKYDLSSGAYISTISLQESISNQILRIYYLDGTLYADAHFYQNPSDDNYLLQKINLSSGEQIGTYFTAGETHKGWYNQGAIFSSTSTFCFTGKRSLFIQQYMDTAMALSPDTVTPFMTIRSRDIITKEGMKELKEMPVRDRFHLDKIWGLGHFVEYKEYLFFNYQKKMSSVGVVYNKKNGDVKQYNKVSNDFLFDKTYRSLHQFGCVTEKGLYNYIESRIVPGFCSLIVDGLCSGNLDKKEELMKLDEDSNPVIFYYEFKED